MARRKATSTTAEKTEKLPIEEAAKAEEVKAEEPKAQETFTAEAVQKMIAEALAKQQEAFNAQMKAAPTVVAVEPEKVVLRWQAEVADDNEAVFGVNGAYGKITGKRGTLTIPKAEFSSRFLDANILWYLKNRWLIVVSGLTQEEMQMYDCDYKEGEILDRQAFAKLLEMSDEELLEIFPKLCKSHREMVACRFWTDYSNGGAHTNGRRALIKALNDISKQDYADTGLPNDSRKKGMFAPILEAMNKKDL